MIRAFAAALEDDNLLVRRAALDLLVTSLRLDSVSVKNSRAEDRAILMRAAYSVILRRDLALNRRLYLWLLGPDENGQQQDVYFRENALELLKSTLEVCSDVVPPPQSPYRLVILGGNVQTFGRVLGIPSFQDFCFTA